MTRRAVATRFCLLAALAFGAAAARADDAVLAAMQDFLDAFNARDTAP